MSDPAPPSDVERVARAMAESAGFAWEACAQDQWRRDARAGIAALPAAGAAMELREALERVLVLLDDRLDSSEHMFMRDEIDRARAALASAPARDGWMDIKTLPEMQRAFVGRYEDLGADVAVPRFLWRQVEAWWWMSQNTPYWSWGDTDPLYGAPPTHWHPTIKPPSPPSPQETP